MSLPRRCCLVLLAALSGCSTTQLGARRGPLTGVEHWLAPDFGTDKVARHCDRFAQVGPGLAREAARTAHLTAVPGTLVQQESRALARLPQGLVDLSRTEVGRLRDPVGSLRSLAPKGGPDDVARNLADDLANLPAVLGLDRRPMGEVDDREHRTDPHDDHPEKSLGTRLLRRLGF